MSVADEIEKLEGLRQQGVINNSEFEKQKLILLDPRIASKPKKRLVVQIFLGLVGVCGLVISLNSFSGAGGKLPACNSNDAREVITNAIEKNAINTTATFKLLDMTNAKETLYDDKQQIRKCNATLVLNSGREQANYILSHASDGTLLVEVQPLN